MRGRERRLPERGVDGESRDDDHNLSYGVQPFNCLHPNTPLSSHQLEYPYLGHEMNHVCKHCDAILWKEQKHTYNCCNGRSALPRLLPIPPDLMSIFSSPRFRAGQRRYNGLFAFTGLGAGGIEKRTWTVLRC